MRVRPVCDALLNLFQAVRIAQIDIANQLGIDKASVVSLGDLAVDGGDPEPALADSPRSSGR